MRYAVITDVHGDTVALRRVLDRLGPQRVDRMICLGDLFDCRVSKADTGYRYGRLEEVFDPDPGLVGLVATAVLVRGNQEERIAGLVPAGDLPAHVRPALFAPTQHRTGFATYTHGHLLSWENPEPGLWCPSTTEFSGTALVHGHHHHSRLFHRPPGAIGWAATVRLDVEPGLPVALTEPGQYLVNVGPVRGPRPTWVVVDEVARTVTYHHETSREAR